MERNDKSIPQLLRDAMHQLGDMVRDEAQLARAEMSEKWEQVVSAGGMFAGALAFGVGGMVLVLMAAAAALSQVMATWAASLLVGAVALLVAVLLGAKAQSNLKPRNLAPTRTMESMRTDARFAKEKVR